MKIKTRFYHLTSKCKDSRGKTHYVTVVGKFEQDRNPKRIEEDVVVNSKKDIPINGKLIYYDKRLLRRLTIGHSICHPTDEFDETIGISVAKGKIKDGRDLGILETNSANMLTKDMIMLELLGKLTYITDNIDNFITEDDD